MSSELDALFVACGGALGAPARLVADRLASRRAWRDFPAETLVVNLTGSFALGLLTGLALSSKLGTGLTAFAGIGFCGAYTTFSAWSYENLGLLGRREFLEAALNALGSVVVGVLVAGGGLALGVHA